VEVVAVVLSGKTKAQLLQRRCALACCATQALQTGLKTGQASHTQHCVGKRASLLAQFQRGMAVFPFLASSTMRWA